MEHTEDERVVIYIALSNSIALLQESLEGGELNENQQSTAQYLIGESIKLLDRYKESLKGEEPTNIPRPKWDNIELR